jgi:hypothetical protein
MLTVVVTAALPVLLEIMVGRQEGLTLLQMVPVEQREILW